MSANIINDVQEYNGYNYSVSGLILASKDLDILEIKVSDIFTYYGAPNKDSLSSFIEHVKRTDEADLNYPIILAPTNFILDGKHRLAKAIITGEKTIKAVRFKEMPNIGTEIND